MPRGSRDCFDMSSPAPCHITAIVEDRPEVAPARPARRRATSGRASRSTPTQPSPVPAGGNGPPPEEGRDGGPGSPGRRPRGGTPPPKEGAHLWGTKFLR